MVKENLLAVGLLEGVYISARYLESDCGREEFEICSKLVKKNRRALMEEGRIKIFNEIKKDVKSKAVNENFRFEFHVISERDFEERKNL